MNVIHLGVSVLLGVMGMSVLLIDMARFRTIGTRNTFQLKYVDDVVLRGKMDKEALSLELEGQRCELDITEANYGGKRYWFLCPECGSRKRVLLYKGGRLACRGCLDLPYPSLMRTKTDPQYYWDQALKIARSIDPRFRWENDMQGMTGFPPRPPGMNMKKYMDKFVKFYRYVDQGNSYWISKLGKG